MQLPRQEQFKGQHYAPSMMHLVQEISAFFRNNLRVVSTWKLHIIAHNMGQVATFCHSACDFGQDLHVPYAGSNSKSWVRLCLTRAFHTHYHGLATDPLLFPLAEFRGQDENKFQFAPPADLGVGIEEDAAGA
jgi:hypothetical protein